MQGVVGILTAFIVIIVLVNHRVNLGVSMAAGAVILGLISGLGTDTFTLMLHGVIEKSTLELTAAVVLIGILGLIMKETGSLDKMLDFLLRLIKSPKILLMVVPGLIGLLSVPGGAIMSAPMIDNIGDRAELSPEGKTSTNILFRHIWYFCYPLFQTLILASDLAGISKYALIAINVPILIVGAVTSYLVSFNGIKTPVSEKTEKVERYLLIQNLIYSLLPIIVTLILGIAFKLSFVIALSVGIVIALFYNIPPQEKQNPFSAVLKRVKKMLIPGININILSAVLGIMAFRKVVDGSGAISTLANRFFDLGVPLWILVLILPFITGFATGMNFAAIGINIPIFLPLMPGGIGKLTYVALLFASSVMGYLISPLHLCVALTREYFKADFAKVFKKLIIPVTAMSLTALLMVLLV